MKRFFCLKSAGVHLGILVLLPAIASAGPLAFEGDALTVLDATAGDWTEHGVGSPSVAYDSVHDRLLMAFESKLADPDRDCPSGLWGIGLAESSDGISWTLMNVPRASGDEPIIAPTEDGGYYACVAAHPTIRFDAESGDAHVYFKAETVQAEEEGYRARYTGVGRAVLSFAGPAEDVGGGPPEDVDHGPPEDVDHGPPEGHGPAGDAGGGPAEDVGGGPAEDGGGIPDDVGSAGQLTGVEISDAPVLSVDFAFGQPKVVLAADNLHYMLLLGEGEAYMASADGAGSDFEWMNADAGELPVPVVSTVGWATTGLYTSSLVCGDGDEPLLTSYIGGTTFSPTFSGAWGGLTSDDGISWTEEGEYVQWESDTEWRHFDALRYTDDFTVGLTVYSTDKVVPEDPALGDLPIPSIVVRSTVTDPAGGLNPAGFLPKTCVR